MVKRELRARYIGLELGLLWSYINPFTRFLIYYFVFGIILGPRPDTRTSPIHLFAGMVVVNFFTETFNSGHPLDRAEQVAGAEDARCRARCSRSPRCWSRSTTPARSW